MTLILGDGGGGRFIAHGCNLEIVSGHRVYTSGGSRGVSMVTIETPFSEDNTPLARTDERSLI